MRFFIFPGNSLIPHNRIHLPNQIFLILPNRFFSKTFEPPIFEGVHAMFYLVTVSTIIPERCSTERNSEVMFNPLNTSLALLVSI